MKRILPVILLVGLTVTGYSQSVFFQQSFEKPWGFSISDTFDNKYEDYSKRDTTMLGPNTKGMDFVAYGKDGDYYLGFEDLDGEGKPADAVVQVTIDSIDISTKSRLELVLSLAGNATANKYDEASLGNGDSVSIEVSFDTLTWERIGFFCAKSGSNSGPMYLDLNNNGLGGDAGEPSLGAKFQDFTLPITGTGSMLYVRISIRLDSGDEEIALDNVRVQEAALDPKLDFGITSITVPESAGSFYVVVDGANLTTTAVTCDANIVSSTATSGTDFTFSKTSLSFSSMNPKDSFMVSITDDSDIEGNENIVIGLENRSSGAVFGDSVVTITIEENDFGWLTIKETREDDADLAPTRWKDGNKYWVGGVINNDVNLRDGGLQVSMQSGGWGTTLFESSDDLGFNASLGDSVEVLGKVGFYNGLAEMVDIDSIIVHTAGITVTPEVVTEMNEANESKLVTFKNCNLVDTADWNSAATGDYNVAFTNGTDTFEMRINVETTLAFAMTPAANFDITGIVGQWHNSAPYDEGYQLFPRSADDMDLLVGLKPSVNAKMSIYPNPTSGLVFINTSENIDFVKVINLVGTEVMTFSNVKNQVDISDLSEGVYLLQGTLNNGETFIAKVNKK